MSSIVVSFATGASSTGEFLTVTSPIGEENDITVTPTGERSNTPFTVVGGGLNDSIDLSDDGIVGDATVLGLSGNDTIMGGAGDDFIDGGEGNDTIMGGMGADIIKGGGGNDVFEFASDDFMSGNMDLIADFDAEDGDRITLMGVSDRPSYDSGTGLVSVDGEEVIDIGRGLEGVEIEQDDDGNWEIF